MTDEEWKDLESRSRNVFFSESLLIDGYKVTIQKMNIDKLGFKYGLMTYINNQLKLKWLIDDCEERRRFFRKITKNQYSKKLRDSMKKMGKKFLKERAFDPDAKIIIYKCYWNNIKSMRRHFESNNKDIRIYHEPSDVVGVKL